MQTKIVIEPQKGLKLFDWLELWKYRDLFMFFVWRDIKVRYAQSALGIGWALIQPLFSMIVFTIVFGRLAKVDSNGVPYAIFSYTALVPWTYFANAVTESASSLVTNAHMLRKVYFPRIILPMSSVFARTVDFLISFLFLLILMAWFHMVPNRNIIILPFLIIVTMFSAAGLGMWLTALAVQYRDVNYGMRFLVQLLMYATPVVYPTTLIPRQWQFLYALNPMVGVIEGFRSALLGTIAMPWTWIILGSLSSLILLVSGAVYFRAREKVFADVA